MYLKQTMLIITEDKCEGIKYLISAKPDVPCLPVFQTGFEIRFIFFTHDAVKTIGGNEQIIVSKLGGVVYLATKF